jgi:hypothetical protein
MKKIIGWGVRSKIAIRDGKYPTGLVVFSSLHNFVCLRRALTQISIVTQLAIPSLSTTGSIALQ